MENAVPRFYADGLQVLDNGVTAQLIYLRTPPVAGPSLPEQVVIVQTPVAALKVNAFLTRKYILGRERILGEPFLVPRSMAVASQIAAEDWTTFWAHPEV